MGEAALPGRYPGLRGKIDGERFGARVCGDAERYNVLRVLCSCMADDRVRFVGARGAGRRSNSDWSSWRHAVVARNRREANVTRDRGESACRMDAASGACWREQHDQGEKFEAVLSRRKCPRRRGKQTDSSMDAHERQARVDEVCYQSIHALGRERIRRPKRAMH